MKLVPFGGPLGTVFDGKTGLTLHPRCWGQASVPDEARDDLVAAAPLSILKHAGRELSQALSTGRGFDPSITQSILTAVSAAAGAELRVPVQIGSFDLAFNDEDVAGLKAAEAAARQAAQAAPPPAAMPYAPAPGPVVPQAAAPAYGAAPAAAPGAPYGAAPVARPPGATPAAPGKSKTGLLIGVIGGGLVLLGIVFGLVWHFTHEPEHAAPSHERPHGKH